MNTHTSQSIILTALLLSGAAVAAESQQDLLGHAKISEAKARETVLSMVPPASVIQSFELERENGCLIWSYDIKRPSATTITEIQIDAVTGDLAGKHEESALAEAAERAAEKH